MPQAMLNIELEIIYFSEHGGGSHSLVLESHDGKIKFVQPEP